MKPKSAVLVVFSGVEMFRKMKGDLIDEKFERPADDAAIV